MKMNVKGLSVTSSNSVSLVRPVPVSPRVPPCCSGYRLALRSLCLPEGNPGASSMCWLPHPPTEGGPAHGLTPLQRRKETGRGGDGGGGGGRGEEDIAGERERKNVSVGGRNRTAACFHPQKKKTFFKYLHVCQLFTWTHTVCLLPSLCITHSSDNRPGYRTHSTCAQGSDVKHPYLRFPVAQSCALKAHPTAAGHLR